MSHASAFEADPDGPVSRTTDPTNLIRFVAAIAILFLGLGTYLWISPSTLARETFSVDDNRYTTRLYVSGNHVYAQCSTSGGGASTMQVAPVTSKTNSNAHIVLDQSAGQITFSLHGSRVACYDTKTNQMIPKATGQITKP